MQVAEGKDVRLGRLQRSADAYLLPDHLQDGGNDRQSNQIQIEGHWTHSTLQLYEAHTSFGGIA